MAITKVTNTGITDDSINADKIADDTLSAADIAPGTITNAKLAGSITNAKLQNSSITINSSATSLGGSASDLGGLSWQSVVVSDGSTVTTMVAGRGYFVDNSSASGIVKLPTSASAGDTIAIKDYAGNFGTNSLLIQRNGHNVQGVANDSKLSTNRASAVLVYVDATKGWLYSVESNPADLQNKAYISATGGTVTTSGNDRIHSFTGDGCFVVASVGNCAGGTDKVSYMVVAGGGGGMAGGAGGGAGGYREGKTPATPYTASPLVAPAGLTVTAQTYPITVGAGGASPNAGPSATPSDKGSNSVFSTITSTGGGGGGNGSVPAPYPNPFGPPNSTGVHFGEPGGSGSGAIKFFNALDTASGGSGNTPPVSPPQGNDGGDCPGPGGGAGAGGGGAGSAGSNVPASNVAPGGNGGNGTASEITASPVTRAGGGGGGGRSDSPGNPNQGGGSAGPGGGGAGGSSKPATAGTSGSANTGGGGGGGGKKDGETGNGGAGGSGVVVIRYKYQN